MSRQRVLGSIILVALLFVLAAGAGQAQGRPAGGTDALLGTAFTYQGKLLDNAAPANGVYDFRFSLYDSDVGGAQLGGTIGVDDVSVVNGLFTVQLDYGGNIFTGEARWLEIEVKRDADGAYTLLTPRVPLTPSPHALALPGLWTQQNATSPNLIGGYWGNPVTAGVVGATIGGGGASAGTNRVTDDYGTVSGGYNNQAGDSAGLTTDRPYATVGGGRTNVASGGAATIGGGYLNWANADYATVGGGYINLATAITATIAGGHDNQVQARGGAIAGGMRNLVGPSGALGAVGGGYLNSAGGAYSVVGGGYHNTVSGGYATIGGGNENDALSAWSTIGGGYDNQTNGVYSYQTIGGGTGNSTSSTSSTVGGGSGNQANGSWSTVGGGGGNAVALNCDYGTIGGGNGNTISLGYDYATIGGGYGNTASGTAATVPGGYQNTASGNYSFAAGRQARAEGAGCFVWADSVGSNLTCTSAQTNRWLARASGGVYFYTNSASSSGVYMLPGDSSWRSLSGRAFKENFAPVDTVEVLRRLVRAPMMTWNYKAQDPAIRHIGLLAEDFNALVDGVGAEAPEHISSLDADGVALAAIQGLYQVVQEKDARIAALSARVAALEGAAGGATASGGPTVPVVWLLVGALAAAPGTAALALVLARRGGGR